MKFHLDFRDAAKGLAYQVWPHVLWISETPRLDWWIVSHGGVATTTLLEFLSAHGRVNHPYDQDRLKHLVRPPARVRPRKCFLYVYGDPVLAVMSLYRRGYVRVQARKNGNVSVKRLPVSVDDYANQGVDALRLTRHLESWLHMPLRLPVVFIDAGEVWENAVRLLAVLDLELVQPSFPPQQQRRSDLGALRPETRRSLQTMYGKYYDLIRGLPPVMVR